LYIDILQYTVLYVNNYFSFPFDDDLRKIVMLG
jgi:hypothetical protein